MASILDQDFGDESDEGDFNPAATVDSDEESPKANGQRQKGAALSGENSPQQRSDASDDDAAGDGKAQEEDEDEGDDEDDEDEEAITRRPRKRARRDPRNQFLDVEAEVDEEDEGDEEDEEGQEAGFIADTHPDDLADLPDGAPADDRRHRELDRERERRQQLDAEEQAALLREKYGRRTTTTSDAAIVPRRLLLPSVDDPSIWGVKCKPTKEREIINSIMKRVEQRAMTRTPLPIISAFERGGSMAGYIYIEARRQADVFTALDGIMNVYPRTKIVLVPIKEMPDLLRVTKAEQLQPGGYVRIKSGLYAGDLAQIDDVETNGLTANLKIVPRLDYGQNEIDAPMVDGNTKGEAAKRKRAGAMGLNKVAVRPPPRLFSESEAKKKHGRMLTQESGLGRKVFKYMNKEYVNGYLMQEFKIQRLITENVNPTLEEVTRFTSGGEDGTENLDLSALAQTLKKGSATENYLPGDIVEVYEGEQSGVVGKAVAVRGDIVTISVTDGDLQGQHIEVPQKGLRKKFKEGDHVKVIGGSKYRDEVGMVVRIEKDTVTLLGDLSLQEITVFSKDLREAGDSGIAGGLGQFDIHDLVQLDATTVGCVTKVDRESLRVLDQNGSVRTALPSQISNKIEKRRQAVATDRNGSEIRIDDLVRELGGEQKTGTILHIYRSFIFIYNREVNENSGISVLRATNVATVAAKGGRVTQGGTSGPDLTKMNPAVMRNGMNGNGGMAPPKSFGRDRALGQTVTIRKGPYKGLLGIVKDTTDNEARVELHTKGKTITVAKETLGFKDPATGQTLDYTRFATARRPPPSTFSSNFTNNNRPSAPDPFASSHTPLNTSSMSGGRTPAWQAQGGGRTPAWSASANTGARTPGWQQASGTGGGRTPGWSASNDGSRTVNPYADGSRTQYGGAGGNRTPAWNPTATASSYSHDPFGGGGGRTPAYLSNGSSRGGGGGAYDAPTPGREYAGGAAPTPGASAMTPAATTGQTPKFSGDAPTPFASGLPETPGYSGALDGPRYEEGTPSP